MKALMIRTRFGLGSDLNTRYLVSVTTPGTTCWWINLWTTLVTEWAKLSKSLWETGHNRPTERVRGGPVEGSVEASDAPFRRSGRSEPRNDPGGTCLPSVEVFWSMVSARWSCCRGSLEGVEGRSTSISADCSFSMSTAGDGRCSW